VKPGRVVLALLAAASAALALPARALADADSVLVRVGGDLAGRTGDYIDVPVTVDLSGAPGRQLGSYRAHLTWNPGVLEFSQISNGSFAAPQVNSAASDSGRLQLTAVQPAGAGGVVTVFVARFYVLSDSTPSNVTVSFDEMSATATSVTPFEVLLPLLRYVQGTFCRSLGRWGDVNGDGQANSLDALVALSVVVGISVDTTVMTPALADVDGDGQVTSRDALIILSAAVGLPVTGYRVLLPAAGACATGAATTLAVTPDSIEMEAGQGVAVVVQATDASGRAVPADSVTWTSSNPAIAAYDPAKGAVQARSAGVATLTAQLGPGVRGSLKVSVLARRTTWYVDVQRAVNAPVQVGSQAWPFQFIGDAATVAQDGDTVLVAAGTYEEVVSTGTAITVLGDSTNRPVVDPRGASYWYPYDNAIYVGGSGAPLALANLVVRAGSVYLSGVGVSVRNVAIEGLSGTNGTALEISPPYNESAPASPGNVLVRNVAVTADSVNSGIQVDLADTATIVNSSAIRSVAGGAVEGFCGYGGYTSGGITIQQASVSLLSGNTVINPACQGVGVFDYPTVFVTSDLGRATITGNRVTGAPGMGIAVGTREVALGHNAVKNVGASGTGNQAAGIYVFQDGSAPDTVTSVGDTVIGGTGRGFVIDTAAVGLLDSLVLDSIGASQNEGGGDYGVQFARGGQYRLSHAHISNVLYDDAVTTCGAHAVLRTIGNRIAGAGYDGISSYNQYACSQRETNVSPDTLISVSDTITASYDGAIYSSGSVYTLVDSAVVDSTGSSNGIDVELGSWMRVANSSLLHPSLVGVNTYQVNHVEILRNSFVRDGDNGIYVNGAVDSVLIFGNSVDSAASDGISLDGGINVVIDSTRVTNSGASGVAFAFMTGGLLTRSRFQGNARYGIERLSNCCNTDSVVVRESTIQGNLLGGIGNFDTEMSSSVFDASGNYWGDPNGPRCATFIEGCSGQSVTGDSITTNNVLFGAWLSGAPPTPAPPFRVLASRGASQTAGAARPAASASRVAARSGGRPSKGRSASFVAARPMVRSAPTEHRAAPAPWHRPVHATGVKISRRH
jgi:dockerin type I repeat protein/parallel beta helix pectate lyase-like protein/Big-like domain-containing protein